MFVMVEDEKILSNSNIFELLMKDLAKFKVIADYMTLHNLSLAMV